MHRLATIHNVTDDRQTTDRRTQQCISSATVSYTLLKFSYTFTITSAIRQYLLEISASWAITLIL